MNKLFRENSLERTPEQRGVKAQHSPWTAPRNKKKCRSEYSQPLPDLKENLECSHTGNETQRQQDVKPRFIADKVEKCYGNVQHGGASSPGAAAATRGGSSRGGWAQGFSVREEGHAAHAHKSEALDQAGGATGITSRRPSSAGSALGAPSHTWGLTCDPFRVLQTGATDEQRHMQLSGTGGGRASGPHGQHVSTCDVHSCDYPAAVAPPVDPIMPESCSADFASVHARRPAFQAAFYFGARRRPSEHDSEPFTFGEHGPLAAGVQCFSTSLPEAQVLHDSAETAAGPQLGAAAPDHRAQRLRGRISCADEQQGTQLGSYGDMCGAVDAMEVCGSGGRGEGTPQARHTQLLWPASLQKLRRGGTRSPKVSPPDAADPDMQPLGRHISGGRSAVGCETPEAACHTGEQHSGKAQVAEAFVEFGENVPGHANRTVMHVAVESTPYEEGRARSRSGARSSLQQQPQPPSSVGRSQLSDFRSAGQEMLSDGGNSWQGLSMAPMQAAGASPMQMDLQPSRLGQLHAVMEMSTLDASHNGAHLAGSVTQLEVHCDGKNRSIAQMRQWHVAMQSDEPHTSSCSSSGEGLGHRGVTFSPSSSDDSRELDLHRTKLSSRMMVGEDAASPGTILRISGEALLQSFSPFSQGTPGATAAGEEDFHCSQASNGDLAPMKAPGAVSVKDAAKDGQLATFNDRLHKAVENGDVDLVGQAWQQVHTGAMQPDIDTLNTLLKSFCRVKGDPSPKEAEQLVAAAMKHGCQPNAATYHHLTDIGMRHEMMSCPDDEPDVCYRDPFVTP
ncbi:hypothetical protein COCOBI_07-5630 [Coccomyxa sp. Obi]|nr:hypothetical protein COCOBI_07-5630 [Coccomyxa sp. Obi]